MMSSTTDSERTPIPVSRRAALKSISSGFGYLAFAVLAHEQAQADAPGGLRAASGEAVVREKPLAPRWTHFEARAKRVIFLSMRGAPSHIDTFDYKPQLAKDDGKPGRYARLRSNRLLGSPWSFSQHGKSGLWVSELLPSLARHVDKMCLLHGMHTDVCPTIPRLRPSSIPALSNSCVPRWERGRSMASGRRTKICPALSPSIRRLAARRISEVAFCRPSTRRRSWARIGAVSSSGFVETGVRPSRFPTSKMERSAGIFSGVS